MHLVSLEVSNFKNIERVSYAFSGVNLFSGPNGSGKTNRLDALYYLCLTRSFSGLGDVQLIRNGMDHFFVSGKFILAADNELRVQAGYQQGKKLFKRDGQVVSRLADHIGDLPVVLIAPTDTLLITDGSEIRRRFLDGCLSQCHPDYLDALLRYQRLLQQRNALLKSGKEHRRWDLDLLQILSDQMQPDADCIQRYRDTWLEYALPRLQLHYQTMAGEQEMPGLRKDRADWRSLEAECEAGSSLFGPQRDKLHFELNGQSLRQFASQGQQKSFLIALKLAQHDYIVEKKNRKPLLLLDDIFEKLDKKRLHYLMDLVTRDAFGQIFITDTDSKRVLDLFSPLGIEVKHFEVGG